MAHHVQGPHPVEPVSTNTDNDNNNNNDNNNIFVRSMPCLGQLYGVCWPMASYCWQLYLLFLIVIVVIAVLVVIAALASDSYDANCIV